MVLALGIFCLTMMILMVGTAHVPRFHLSTCDFCLALCTSAPFLFLRPKQRENTLHSPDVKMFPSEKKCQSGSTQQFSHKYTHPQSLGSSGPCSQALVHWLPHIVCFLAMQHLALNLLLPGVVESRRGKVEAKCHCLPHTVPG